MKIVERLGPKVRRLRLEKGWSQAFLAKQIPMSQASLHRIEVEETLHTTKLVSLARALDVSAEELDPFNEQEAEDRASKLNLNSLLKVKLVEWDQIDKFIKDENVESAKFLFCPKISSISKKTYALRVENDSMRSNSNENVSFLPGEYIIVDKERKEKSGDFIIYNSPLRPILRKLIIEDKKYLMPLNSNYEKTEIPFDKEFSSGVVVSKMSFFE
jgi:SOS-response transcriptional repressor LexA